VNQHDSWKAVAAECGHCHTHTVEQLVIFDRMGGCWLVCMVIKNMQRNMHYNGHVVTDNSHLAKAAIINNKYKPKW